MELDQLIPETATITKVIKGEDEERTIELVLRPFNIEDESWLKRAFGERLKELFESMDMDTISRVCFHQLDIDSKREIMKLKFMDMDEDGNESEVAKTGPRKIAMITVGYPEQIELLQALLKTRGFSMPIIEELGDHLVSEANKQTEGKSSKARKKKSIGRKSSTRSQANTVGRSKSSKK